MDANPNASWRDRSLRHVWHPCTQMKQQTDLPLGPRLFDMAGQRFLDGVSSWWVNLFGHANPRINAALTEQLNTLEHAMLAGFTHPLVVELSERLSALTGGALGHCFYASDGASAVEIALKMRFHYWRNQGHAGCTYPLAQALRATAGTYLNSAALQAALEPTDLICENS